MNSLASWIDRSLLDSIVNDLASVENLTEDFTHLLHTPPAPTQSLSHQDFHGGPERPPSGLGQTDAQLQRFRDCLQSVSNRFQHSGLWKNGQPPDGALPPEATANPLTTKRGVSFFVAPQGNLGARLRALQDWLHSELPGLGHLFVIDSQGCLATDQEPPAPLLATAIVLADAARRTRIHLPTGPDCAMHTELSAQEKLCVITADSPALGTYSLAVVTPYTFPSGSTERIRAALLRALNGTS